MSTLEVAPENNWYPQPPTSLPQIVIDNDPLEYVYLLIFGTSLIVFLMASKFQS